MSETDQNASGVADVSSGNDANQINKKDSVQYETYQKVLAEKKRMQQDREEIAAKLKKFEDKELEAQGKHQELLESLRKDNKDKEDKLSKVVQTFAMKTVESQIIAEAQKHGCLDNEALLKLIDINALEVDMDKMQVNADDLNREMEKVIKARNYLFKKNGPKFNDVTPGNNAPISKSLADMSKDDLLNAWRNAKN
jgi:hypothetical protein